jgi:hypothetical protein
LAARQLYVYGLIQQAKSLACDHRSTGTCTTRCGFAHATLENPKIDVFPIPNVGKSYIDPLWETLMTFDQRAEFVNCHLLNVLYMQNTVRIAHGYRANFELRARDFQNVAIRLLIGDKRDVCRIEFR